MPVARTTNFGRSRSSDGRDIRITGLGRRPQLVERPTEFTPGHQIELHVEAPQDSASLQAAVTKARPQWEWLLKTEAAVRAAVASQLTEAHNEYCDPEDEVSEEQFAGRLRLLSAKFEEAGTLELSYLDGMFFGGHWIIVPVGADGAIGTAYETG